MEIASQEMICLVPYLSTVMLPVMHRTVIKPTRPLDAHGYTVQPWKEAQIPRVSTSLLVGGQLYPDQGELGSQVSQEDSTFTALSGL